MPRSGKRQARHAARKKAGHASGAESDGETDVIFFSKDDLGSKDFVSDFETAHDLFKLDVAAASGAIQFDDAIVNGHAATEVTVTAEFNGVAGNETLTFFVLSPVGTLTEDDFRFV